MKRHSIDQEEVIMRLSEIYHQLEVAESLLNSNISQNDKWRYCSTEKLKRISQRISVLERNNIYFENLPGNEKSTGLEYQKKLKLTLGY